MKSRSPRSTARSRRHGFTLVELMVAMIAGLIAVSGAYFLSASSARQISDQMRLSDTQSALRTGLDQVRRDFARGAYLANRNSAALPVTLCGQPTSTLADDTTVAQVTIDGSLSDPDTGAAVTALLNPGATTTTNLTRADAVTLQGSYAAGTMFPVGNLNPTVSTEIEVDDTTTTYQMVFSDAPPGGGPAVPNYARFGEVFATGRAVRFESDGRFYFRRITGVTLGTAVSPPVIQLDAALPNDTCAPRAGAFVSVVSMIQYQVDPVDGANTPVDLRSLRASEPSAGVTQQALGVNRAVLVRRELSYVDGSPLAGALSVVLDNIVEFQVNGIQNTAASPATPVFQEIDEASAPTIQDVSTNNPERLRALVVTLSARSMEGDRVRTHMPRASLDLPMFTFQQGTGPADPTYFVSRVRTMRAEIFLPNTTD